MPLKLKLLSIDFAKPWWNLIFLQKHLLIVIFTIGIVCDIFWSLSPFLIAYVLELQNIFACIALFVTWVLIDCLYAYSGRLNTKFQLQCIHSIYQNAHQRLLVIDPRYHVHRSSGAILSKIERAARGYEDILDQITFEFTPLVVGTVTMFITIGQFSLSLAIGISSVFLAIIVSGYYFARYACRPWENNFIATDDAFKQVAVENLAQIHLVRATFASDYINSKLIDSIENNSNSEATLWLAYITMTFVLNMVYLGTIFCLVSVLFWQVHTHVTSAISAIGLVLAYIQSTKRLVKIIKPFRRYMRGWAAVSDLFKFISTFGKQTYPVLGSAIQGCALKNDSITVKALSVSFNYEKAELFNDHSLLLECKNNQVHKLYGIIGPSGSGKSTLLSIIGGQLQPNRGMVTINDIDIYAVPDSSRRQLIALQGQIATSLQGTVAYNLTFGLPEHHGYSEHYLFHILNRVGLAQVLTHGLDTMLGEGGLNLSGGQRQRLNFASLYLRAHYYKPVLVLIDEPTSSLDEISEAAITDMMVELSQFAITLVIAHRLKTVENAIGLIDLSLLKQQKEIVPYFPEDLAKISHYYKQLIKGNINLDT